jgi:hypothetical protein
VRARVCVCVCGGAGGGRRTEKAHKYQGDLIFSSPAYHIKIYVTIREVRAYISGPIGKEEGRREASRRGVEASRRRRDRRPDN